jgi:peptidyl-tRNA hydrolase
VGKSFSKDETRDYVLSSFSRSEQKAINSLLDKASCACRAWAMFGIEKAMNDYNKKEDN